MYKTKMVKVCLSSFSLCIFSLLINLVVLDMATLRAIAQDSASELDRDKAANTVKTTLEPEILSEINRVRTNPQAYAQWLEAQRRYYDGIWLKLPGEKPIRTNRGLKALEEAIAVLKTQQPLSPLDISEQTAATATSKLENFATANNIQNISYGRITAKGIVMGIVVDDLFPDRRRRNNLLSPDAANTGVVCKPDPRYAKVCAIAYSDSTTPVDVADPQPATTTPETETTASQPETRENNLPEVQVPTATPETETTASQPETTENNLPEQPATPDNDNDTAAETLPQPPQPQTIPGVPEITPSTSEENTESSSRDNQDSAENIPEETIDEATETADSNSEVTTDENTEVANSDSEEITDEDNEAELDQPETTDEKTATADSDSQETTDEETATTDLDSQETASEDTEAESETEANQDEENVEVFEAETENPESEIATNSDSSRLLENVIKGILETGDRTIAEDGSLYDSYPLEGKAGDSFTIELESDEFDPFVALIDDQGNIIKQNDDIDKDNSNSRIQVTIPQDGVYNIIVNAYDQGGKGNYVLTVRQ
jgi:chemotaxis protein histidine kinase CheA